MVCYLKGTKSPGILFEKQEEEACVLGYVDANYAEDSQKKIHYRLPLRLWWMTDQLESYFIVNYSLPTTEAEYTALSKAGK